MAGGVGSVARYLLGGWIQRAFPATFPLGTLTINLGGCLFIGFLTATLTGRLLIREEYRVAVTIGLLGGFTTFSTFGIETFLLLNDGQFAKASLNVLASVVGGLFAVWVGYRSAEYWFGA